MIKLKKPSYLITSIFTLLLLHISFAQQATVAVIQDEKISRLLELKNTLAKENKLTDGFTIQLYSGNIAEANAVIKEYETAFPSWPATIKYETPNYKVWVGNFATRLEADQALLIIQSEFGDAFVFKPGRG